MVPCGPCALANRSRTRGGAHRGCGATGAHPIFFHPTAVGCSPCSPPPPWAPSTSKKHGRKAITAVLMVCIHHWCSLLWVRWTELAFWALFGKRSSFHPIRCSRVRIVRAVPNTSTGDGAVFGWFGGTTKMSSSTPDPAPQAEQFGRSSPKLAWFA
jgi:hypothetical protein